MLPRVEKAKRLIEQNKVQCKGNGLVLVQGDNGLYTVQLTVDRQHGTCTCPFNTKQNNEQCSHILAARYVWEIQHA